MGLKGEAFNSISGGDRERKLGRRAGHQSGVSRTVRSGPGMRVVRGGLGWPAVGGGPAVPYKGNSIEQA